jgi:arylsulfatase A-like enzyme
LPALVACGGSVSTPPDRPPAPRATEVREASDASPVGDAPVAAPTLADQPRLDLDANRPRWHIVDRGLVLTIGGPGLAKYEIANRSAWSHTMEVDGHVVRKLTGKATLTFPWIDASATRATVTGIGPAKLKLALDGKTVGAVTLPAGWSAQTIDVPGLSVGEHAITIEGARAQIAAVEIHAADAPVACTRGLRRVSLYGELPADAYLVAKPQSAGTVRVRITTEGEPDGIVVYDGASSALPSALPLFAAGEQGDRLARLDLESDACATWDGAQLAVGSHASVSPPAPVKNVVLVVVDTLRSDRLTAYGETRVQTPRITALAKRGAVFLHNQSMAPSSPPSHTTIHTGQYPRVHGVTGDEGEPGANTPMLSAILDDAGFFTGFVGNNDFAMGRLAKAARWTVAETPFYKHGKDCGPIVTRALELVTKAKDQNKRFFLSLLPIEPHVAYRFHEGNTERYYAGPWRPPLGKGTSSKQLGRMKKLPHDDPDWTQVRALYDGEVSHVDACIGALEDGLRASGVLDDTAIIITSDHGEGMGERAGAAGHAYSLHRELVDVPLIIAGGVRGARVTVPSSNADIAPTALALLGLPVDPRMQGRSLVADTLGAAWPRITASEYGKAFAVRTTGYHLVAGYSGTGELYDVRVDPDETKPLDDRAPLALRTLRDAAGMFLAYRKRWQATTWGDLGNLSPGNPLR